MTASTSITKRNPAQEFIQHDGDLASTILLKPCKPIMDPIDPKVQSLIVKMKKMMAGVGIGLAANQVGECLQLFMIEYEPDVTSQVHTKRYQLDFPSVPFQVFINPRITVVSDSRICFWHGCLSCMDQPKGKVATYEWIEYEAINEKGLAIQGRLDGLAAVIFQHEFGHLLGRLYIHKAKEYMTHEELVLSFSDQSLVPYEICGFEVPLLLEGYEVGSCIG